MNKGSHQELFGKKNYSTTSFYYRNKVFVRSHILNFHSGGSKKKLFDKNYSLNPGRGYLTQIHTCMRDPGGYWMGRTAGGAREIQINQHHIYSSTTTFYILTLVYPFIQLIV